MKPVLKRTSAETISEEAHLREIDERHFLAQQIFFRRECRRWSQDELARAAGLTHAQVATVEAGQANPTLRTLAKLSTALSCTVRELFADPERRESMDGVEGRARCRGVGEVVGEGEGTA